MVKVFPDDWQLVPPVTGVSRPTRARASAAPLEAFLARVEKRAFLMAQTLLRDRDEALDAVQDAMFQLARRYHHRPEEEWPPLFYRILHNRVRDLQRRRWVRDRFRGWLPGTHQTDDQGSDPFQDVPDPVDGNPARRLESERGMEALTRAIARLPARQQQAFLLRCWEGLSTADTAKAMQCSDGSVKTHYSRALHSLQNQLEGYRHD